MNVKLNEGVDYELTPSGETEIEQSWDVRILQGDFVETVIRFGNISFDGERDCLLFNFMVVSSPSGLNEDCIELQDHAAMILQSVLENAAAEGSLLMGNPTEEESED
jgi:hypothetical protein